MHLRPADFEQMSVAEFVYAWWGWAKRQNDLQRQAWERTRWQSWILTSIQLDRKDRRPMQQMFPLPWDSESKEQEEMTMEQRRERVKEILQCTK